VAAGDRAERMAGIVEESRRQLDGLRLDFAMEVQRWKADDRAEAEAKRAEAEEWRAFVAAGKAEDHAISEWCKAIEVLADAAMVVAGYHRPKRVWRRKRRG